MAVCKALVTKASVFIPALGPYILALFKVMKESGTHEGCIEQMQRLFQSRLYGQQHIGRDEQGLIRMDDWEMAEDVQLAVTELIAMITPENFQSVSDYAGYREDFLKLNGFGLQDVDYHQEIDFQELKVLEP